MDRRSAGVWSVACVAWLLAWTSAAPGLAQSATPPVMRVMPNWLGWRTSDAVWRQQVADLRARLGVQPMAPVGFNVYVYMYMDDWNVDPDDQDAIRRNSQRTIADIDAAIARARAANVQISLSVLTAIRERYDPLQRAAEAEDVRNVQWWSDNTLSRGWISHSQYARRLRRLQEAYFRELGRVLANRMAKYPETVVAATGDGEVELSYERSSFTGLPLDLVDYSPFAIAEFRDWLRAGGLYAPGQPLAGYAYQLSSRYANDATPRDDTGGDGYTLVGDFPWLPFTTWNLRYFDWSLADDPASDPHKYSLAAFEAAGSARFPDAGLQFFDAPRWKQPGIQPGNPWFDVWNLFRQHMIWRHNRDVARWVTTSADPETGLTIPADRWYSDQIPANRLGGAKDWDPPSERYLSSGSPWWTADIGPYGGLGITAFNSYWGQPYLTLRNVASDIVQRTPIWGVIEYHPSVPNTDVTAHYFEDVDEFIRLRPRIVVPIYWDAEIAYEPGYFTIKDTNTEAALRDLVTRAGAVPPGTAADVTGRVTKNGAPLAGVTIALAGSATATTTTDAEGHYRFALDAPGGDYTVVPTAANHAFTPPIALVGGTSGTGESNFDAAQITCVMSGIVTEDGVPSPGVSLSQGGSATAALVTDADGRYRTTPVPCGGDVTLTPTAPTHVFEPASASYRSIGADRVRDFAARRQPALRGVVRDRSGRGIPGLVVTVESGGDTTSAETDEDGNYHVADMPAGTARVSVSAAGFVFDPPAQDLVVGSAPVVALDVTALDGAFAQYFAEGVTSDLFDTRLALLNLSGAPTTATVRFRRPDGLPEVIAEVPLGPLARASVDPKDHGLATAEFATVVESSQPLIADRTVTWGQPAYGSHAAASVAAPGLSWYLAEGATFGGFDLFYLLQNPSASEWARVEVRYLLPAPQAPLVRVYDVPPASRRTIWVDYEEFPEQSGNQALANTEVSAAFTSTNGVPFIVERAMYSSGARGFGAGHAAAAVEGPRTDWFFAEGSTQPPFDLFILLANPGDQWAEVDAEYMLPSGTVLRKTYPVAPNSRYNIWVDAEGPDLASTAVSVTLRSTNGVPIVAERAMWWGDASGWYEGHVSAGARGSGTLWAVADGEAGGPTNLATYVLIANTSSFAGRARVTAVFEDGTTPVVREFALPPSSRTNVSMADDLPGTAGKRFGTIVESIGDTPAQLVVERSMYGDADGVWWAAGSNTNGVRVR